jgi:ubiquitin-like protein ATG12
MASPSPKARLSDDETEEQAELPLTMAASVVLTSLPKDAHKALEGAGEPEVEKGKVLGAPDASSQVLYCVHD